METYDKSWKKFHEVYDQHEHDDTHPEVIKAWEEFIEQYNEIMGIPSTEIDKLIRELSVIDRSDKRPVSINGVMMVLEAIRKDLDEIKKQIGILEIKL